MARPDVYVYQELANISVTPVTPDMDVCIVGPCYHVLDYENDKSTIKVDDYGTTDNEEKSVLSTGLAIPTSISLSDPPGNELGAILDEESLVIYFDDIWVSIDEKYDEDADGRIRYGENRFYSPGGTFSQTGTEAEIGDLLVMSPTVINRLRDQETNFLDVSSLNDYIFSRVATGTDGELINLDSGHSTFNMGSVDGDIAIIPYRDYLVIMNSATPGFNAAYQIQGYSASGSPAEGVLVLDEEDVGAGTETPLTFFVVRATKIKSRGLPEIQTKISTSYTGKVTGASTFVDSEQRFQTLGVKKGHYLNIPAGVNKGSYRLESVDSETGLTVENEFPVDSVNPVTYTIEERSYHELYTDIDEPLIFDANGSLIADSLDSGTLTFTRSNAAGQKRLTVSGGNFLNVDVGDYVVLTNGHVSDVGAFRIISKDGSGTPLWIEVGAGNWSDIESPNDTTPLYAFSLTPDATAAAEYSVGSAIGSNSAPASSIKTELSSPKITGTAGGATTPLGVRTFKDITLSDPTTFVTKKVKPGDLLMIATGEDDVGLYVITKVNSANEIECGEGTWPTGGAANTYAIFSWGYDNSLIDYEDALSATGDLFRSTTGQKLTPESEALSITGVGDPGSSDTSPRVNTNTVLILAAGVSFAANEMFPAAYRLEHALSDIVIGSAYYYNDGNSIYIGADSTLGDKYVDITYAGSARHVVGASVYVAYRSLRQDLTNMVQVPGDFSPTSGYPECGRPVEQNPIALAVQVALANTNSHVYVLGVSADSDAGYLAALNVLENKPVYCLVPLTTDTSILAAFKNHCEQMSVPTKGKFRIFFGAAELPTYKELVGVNTDGFAQDETGDYDILFDDNATFVSDGIVPGDEIVIISPDDDGTESDLQYLVREVMNNNQLKLNRKWNGDHSGVTVTYMVRRALSKAGQIEYMETIPQSFISKRAVLFWPDSCDFDDMHGNRMTNLPGYYVAAGYAGLVSGYPPHKPFTRLPVAGIDRIHNSNDYFSDDQLDTLTDAGWFIVVQETEDSLPYCIRQYTTDPSVVENAELSVVKAFDYVSLFFKALFKPFIGVWNLNQDTINTMLQVFDSGSEALKRKKYPKIGALLLHSKVTGIDPPGTISSDRFDIHAEIGLPKPYNFLGLHLISV